jgi:hypothetical protein
MADEWERIWKDATFANGSRIREFSEETGTNQETSFRITGIRPKFAITPLIRKSGAQLLYRPGW